MSIDRAAKQKTLTQWITRVWDFFVAHHPSIKDIGEQKSARLAASFVFAIGVLNFIGFIATIPVTGLESAFNSTSVSLIALPIAYFFTRTRAYRLGAVMFSIVFAASSYLSILSQPETTNVPTAILSFVPLSLIVASIFVPSSVIWSLIALNIAALFIIQLFGVQIPSNAWGAAGLVATVGVVLIIFNNFRNTVEKLRLDEVRGINRALETLSTELEKRVKERTSELLAANQQTEKRAKQLQVVADVARAATATQELSRLLNPLTSLISQRFGYYHVGIFLLDEQNQNAILEASNTEGGLKMLARGHRLKVGEQGIVGFVTSRGEPRIALNVGKDAIFFNNPDLPETRSELALPLKIGETILGALDLQSMEENAFSQEDVSVLSILADQVAIAIQNARSAEQAQRALIEAGIATKQLSGEAWTGYAKTIKSKGYRYDGVKSEALKEASVSRNEDGSLSIPVQLRGQTIGRLKLKASDAARNWTEDERAIIESTAERVAIAMEGARLLEEAQKRAARESFLSDVGAKLGTSFQLDSILRDTVEELGQNLKGSTVSFQLINPSAPPTADSPKADGASARRKKAE